MDFKIVRMIKRDEFYIIFGHIRNTRMKIILISFMTAMTTLNVYADSFQLSSSDIQPGKQISQSQVLNEYGCRGENIAPQLAWKNSPSGTQSFAVTMYDPDATNGWWHWIVFNIPSNVSALEQNQLPAGAIQSKNDFGHARYDGPCPPVGDKPHHYRVTVYALKNKLSLDENASSASVDNAIKKNKIAEAEIIATYHR